MTHKKLTVTRLLKALLMMCVILGVPASAQSQKPNILIMVADDLGWADVGYHGGDIDTPSLDRLAQQGVRLNRFYTTPICSPTRAALMTGRDPIRLGVTYGVLFPWDNIGVHPDEHFMPETFQAAGYQTAIVGKWHLGGEGAYAPDKRGFDWCSTNVGGPNVHFDPAMVRNGKRAPRKGYREDIFFDEAMAFMDESKDTPFFCYLATYSPHAPLAAPEEFEAPFRGKVDKEEAAYLGMVANLDYNLGRLMRHLQERKLEDNTILVFMNDNGQTHGLDVFNAGMRGSKCTIWQGGSRAISLWKWAGKWTPHTVSNLAAHLDVLPTLCDLAGATLPPALGAKLEGFNLRPLLESAAPVSWHDDRLLFHHVGRWPSGLAAAHKYAMASVQTGDLLLVRSRPCDDPACKQYSSQCTTLRSVEAGATAATYTKANAQFHWGVTPPGRWSLFDLKNDPTCQKDLAAEKPELASKLASSYDKWWDTLYPTMIQLGGDKGEPELLNKGRVQKQK